MADERTPEQIAADVQLREAIQAVAEAYTEDGSSWVATEYVAVYSMQRWTEEGDALTAVGTAVDGDRCPATPATRPGTEPRSAGPSCCSAATAGGDTRTAYPRPNLPLRAALLVSRR